MAFEGGGHAWLTRAPAPRIVASLDLPDEAGRPVAYTGWPEQASCDPHAIASTTYGPYRSCAALYRSGSRSELRITRQPNAAATDLRVTLPYRYESITAGGWAHAVGGELALGRPAGPDGVAIDILTLIGS